MDPTLRRLFNAAYSDSVYARVEREMCARLGLEAIEFRLAETPLFLGPEVRERCERAAREILAALEEPSVVERAAALIPEAFRVPGMDSKPQTLALDLALVEDESGEIAPRLIECQGFPSLYGMVMVQGEIWIEALGEMAGLDRTWSLYWSGLDRERYVELLRRTVVGDADPEEVVLVDIDPATQKTRPDFAATERLLGVRAVCVSALAREGRRLFAPGRDGRGQVPVRRVYHRVIFDELVGHERQPRFDYREPLDVTWVPHPNWYWIWSKAALPYLDHPAVPEAHPLSDLERWPEDLGRFVLKPFFSFAGRGVVIDVDRARLDAIPAAERRHWLLMEKVDYAPALVTPGGDGVKAELRVLFLRPDPEGELVPASNLVRLSRGKMHGVEYNRDFDWVGSTVAVWERE